MPQLLSLSEVAARLHEEHGCSISPKYLSDLIYRRLLPPSAVVSVAGRRLIPAEHFGDVVAALRARGRLPEPDGEPS